MYQRFDAVGLTADGSVVVEVINFNCSMAICTEVMPVIITREQAMEFFNLVPQPVPNL